MPNFPASVGAVTVHGNIAYVVDPIGSKIWILDRDLQFVDSFGKRGRKKGELFYPNSVAVKDSFIHVVDSFNNRIQVFDSDFRLTEIHGKSGVRLGEHTMPVDIMFIDDNAFVLERDNNRIQVFSSEWKPLWMFGGVYKPPRDGIATYLGSIDEYMDGYGFLYPVRFIRGRKGDMFVVNSGNDMILRLDSRWCKVDDTVIYPYPYSVAFISSGYIIVAPWRESFLDVYTEDFVFVKRVDLLDLNVECVAGGFFDELLVFDVKKASVVRIELGLPELSAFYREYEQGADVEATGVVVHMLKSENSTDEICKWLYDKLPLRRQDLPRLIMRAGCCSPEWLDVLSAAYMDELKNLRDFVYGYGSTVDKWMKELMVVNEEEEEIRKIPHERIDIDLGKIWYEMRERLATHKEMVIALCRAYGSASTRFDSSTDAVDILLDILKLYSDTFVVSKGNKDETVFYRWYFRRLLERLIPHVLWEINRILDISKPDIMLYERLRDFLSENVVVTSGKNDELRELFGRLPVFSLERMLTPKELSDRLDGLFKNVGELFGKGERGKPLSDKLDIYAYLSVDWAEFLLEYNEFWWFGKGEMKLLAETTLLRNLLRKRVLLSRSGSYFHRSNTRWDSDIYRDYLAAVISLEFLRMMRVLKRCPSEGCSVSDVVDFALGVASFHKDASFFKGFEYIDLEFISGLSASLREMFGRSGDKTLLSSFSNAIFPVFSMMLRDRNALILDDSPNLDSAISRLDSLCMLFGEWSKFLVSMDVYPEEDVLEEILKEGWDLGSDYTLYLSLWNGDVPLHSADEREEYSTYEELLYEFDMKKVLNLWRRIWDGNVNHSLLKRFVMDVNQRHADEMRKIDVGIPMMNTIEPRLVTFAETLSVIIGGNEGGR